MLVAVLAGCDAPRPGISHIPAPAAPALTVTFTAPLNARIGDLQQAQADGRQPWRNDPFLVARAEFLGLLTAPPANLNEDQLALLQAIDRTKVENNTGYEMQYDAAKRMHIIFPAPPFRVDAAMDRAQARKELSAVWITHSVVLTPLPRNR